VESIDQRVKGFFISLLVLETGVIGVFVSLDLFLFFLFWEVMLIRCIPDRHLGPRTPHLRGDEIRVVYNVRVDPDAGGDPVALSNHCSRRSPTLTSSRSR